MSFMAKDNGDDFVRELPKAGMHDAVLSKIFDLGMQDSQYGRHHKAMFVWELGTVMSEGNYKGNPFVLTQEFTVSLNEKANLRKTLESWFAKQMTEEQAREGVDLHKYLKRMAQVNIVHGQTKAGKDFAKISVVLPERDGSPILFPTLADDWCPDWIKNKMQAGLMTMDGVPGEVTEEREPVPAGADNFPEGGF